MLNFTEQQIASRNEFIEKLYQNCDMEKYLECRAFLDGKPPVVEFIPLTNLLKGIENFVQKYNETYDVYFGIATRKDQSSGKKENCYQLPAVYLDIDVGFDGHKKNSFFSNKGKALEHIQRIDLDETVIVDSGNGLHVYWNLSNPYTHDNLQSIESEAVMNHLKLLYGGDHVANYDRILRIPYSYNRKSKDNPKFCSIIKSDYDKRVAFNEFKERMNDNFSWFINASLSSKQYELIFGVSQEVNVNDRSAAEQSVITSLVAKDYSSDFIVDVFDTFPTYGKYSERKQTDSEQANGYLRHSIAEAESFVTDQKENNTEKLRQALSLVSNNTGVVNSDNKYNQKQAYVDSLVNRRSNTPSNYNRTYDNKKKINWGPIGTNKNPGQVGYYDEEGTRLCNFTINLEEQVSATIDHLPQTYLSGSVTIDDGSLIRFSNLSAETLARPIDLKKFLLSLCGIEIKFFVDLSQVVNAIQTVNSNVAKSRAMQFGYNEALTEFITSDQKITNRKIENIINPILSKDDLNNNYVGFVNECKVELESIKCNIYEDLFNLKKYDTTLPVMAFSFLPLIYPFLAKVVEGKPYMMIKGASGCGKSTLSKFCQRFYGDFKTLTSCSSTTTSISIFGHALKDVLFAIDDFKESNFNSDYDKKKIHALLQNYYDKQSRSRSDVSLKIRDQKWIRSFLLINAEDLVLTEPSTIARGIIIEVDNDRKEQVFVSNVQNNSHSFKKFTPHFIQHLLGIEREYFSDVFIENRTYFETYASQNELAADNLSRLINNFALLKTAWILFSEYLFANNVALQKSYNELFDGIITEIFVSNHKRIQEYKPEEKFENALWEMVANGIVKGATSGNISDYDKSKTLFLIENKNDDTFKVCLKHNEAYKLVNEYLRADGGIGCSKNTLFERLTQLDKIRIPETGRVTIYGKTIRGAYYTGEVNYDALGITPPIKSSNEEKLDLTDTSDAFQNINEDDLLF